MTDRAWFDAAKGDIPQWAASMPKDADGTTIDWDWVRSLDLAHGVGTIPESTPQSIHDALKADYATRERLESIIAQCNSAFMTDFDRLIGSYRLPRALAYANRRLNDNINTMLHLGEQQHLWAVSRERRGRATIAVLKPYSGSGPSNDDQGMLDLSGEAGGASAGNTAAENSDVKFPTTVALDDIQDRTEAILDARAKRRKAQRFQKRAGDAAMARANLSGATSPGGAALPGGAAASGNATGRHPKPDWRDAYLPGRDVDAVMGIDIETTGIDPARDYIIDVGFEFMNMASQRPAGEPETYAYEQGYYAAGDAYGQSRLAFGVPPENAALGNALIAKLTGIDVRGRSSEAGYRLFDEWSQAQAGLLARLTQQPYVAHNATFEHSWFMLNVAGYAESYRAGRITIIDTLPMSRQWDPGAVPTNEHPYGDNTLDAYAKRQGALDSAHNERHLGLEDSHIMLVAMKHHLAALKAQGKGPWGPPAGLASAASPAVLAEHVEQQLQTERHVQGKQTAMVFLRHGAWVEHVFLSRSAGELRAELVEGYRRVSFAGLDLDGADPRFHRGVWVRAHDQEIDLHALFTHVGRLRIEIQVMAGRGQLLGDRVLGEHALVHAVGTQQHLTVHIRQRRAVRGERHGRQQAGVGHIAFHDRVVGAEC